MKKQRHQCQRIYLSEPLVDVARRVVVEGVAGRVLVLAVWLLVDEDAELVLLLVKAVLEVDWLVLKKNQMS